MAQYSFYCHKIGGAITLWADGAADSWVRLAVAVKDIADWVPMSPEGVI